MSDSDIHRRRGSRYRARKRAVSFLFEAEIRDVDVVELAEERRAMGADSQEFHDVAPYTVEIVTGVAERLGRIDDMIAEHLRDWTLDRLPAVDRAILRVGTWELFHNPDVPARVAVVDTGPVGHPRPGAGATHGGSGLVGLRERVQAVGGTLTAGPIDVPRGSGFRLEATVPCRG